MIDCQVCDVAFATDEVDPLFTAVLAHPGRPNSQLVVVTMGMYKSCVTSPEKHPTVVNSGGTSPGAQVSLWSMLANPTLSVFWMDITWYVCVG